MACSNVHVRAKSVRRSLDWQYRTVFPLLFPPLRFVPPPAPNAGRNNLHFSHTQFSPEEEPSMFSSPWPSFGAVWCWEDQGRRWQVRISDQNDTEGFPVGTASLLPASLTEISAHNSSTRRPNFCPNASKSVKTASIP